ncbi:hypothetical protein [Marinobacterium sp. xm-a-152]|uniref:hypothetical protein n=1 Tax=Marinobacterium sp. xm-a-152 TaxID=2497733 RepID=UPI001567EB0A|nr:hypothetical protein [Marinobacterium sp. xm-a-152]NRP15731.1 hypothetical protein [Marinobacterium sp. xm-a-152]
MQRVKPLLTALLIILPLGVSVYLLQSVLSGFLERDPITTDCDVNFETCAIELPSDSEESRVLSLSMNPKPAKSLVPLTFSFTVDGQQPESAWLDLQGTTEYMGINQTPIKFNGESWSGVTELSVCTTGLMVWKARLIITEQDGESYPVDFFFEAE